VGNRTLYEIYSDRRRKLAFSTTALSFYTTSPANPDEYRHKPYIARNHSPWATSLPLIVYADNFPYPTPIQAKIWGCSLWSKSVLLGSADRGKVRLIVVKLFFKNFNLYDHNTSTLQTDRQTDRQLALAILRSATLRAVNNNTNVNNNMI